MTDDLTTLLAGSNASDGFKADVQRFAARGVAERIKASPYSPAVKVLRLIAHLLHTHPDLPVESVVIDARAGCADFTGTVCVNADGSARRFRFAWDCRWRAEQEGYTDYFGFPDQIRAVREFGWRCFRAWQEVDALECDARLAIV